MDSRQGSGARSLAYPLLLAALVLVVAAGRGKAQEAPPPGPPLFVSPPLYQGRDTIRELARQGAVVGGWSVFAASQKVQNRKPHSPTPTPTPGPSPTPTPTSTPTPAPTPTPLSRQTIQITPADVVRQLDSYQGEPVIGVSGSLLVGGFNSIFPGACSATLANCAPGATVSSDGGVSWTTSNVSIMGNLLGFDPSVSAAAATIYYGYGVCSGSCGTGNLLAATSADGLRWTAHVVTPPIGGVLDDKPWVAADPTTAGRAYMAWDRNQSNNQTILVSRTTDYGVTWSNPVNVSGAARFGRVIYAMPAVDPNSAAVYVVWMDYAKSVLFVSKSTDGGQTWGASVKVTSLGFTFTDIGCDGGRSMTPAPYIVVDNSGVVYVSYADIKGTTGTDIYLTYSTDGGATWAGSSRVNDVAINQQYNPAMSVAGNGELHLSWLDRRDDPNDCQTRTYSTYGILAAGGSPLFAPNLDVSPSSGASDFDGNPNGPGDYTGTTAYINNQNATAATPLFPTHLASDIAAETGSGGGFECYATTVSP